MSSLSLAVRGREEMISRGAGEASVVANKAERVTANFMMLSLTGDMSVVWINEVMQGLSIVN